MMEEYVTYENDNYKYHFGPEYPMPTPEERKKLDKRNAELKKRISEKLHCGG